MRLKQTLVIVVLTILSMLAPAIVSYSTKAQSATPIPAGATIAGSTSKLTPEINALISQPKYKQAQWGLLVSDRKTGEVIYELNSDKMLIPASNVKLVTTAAALDTFGADYRFKTPIHRRGQVNSAGVLSGDLILVASGDLTMGGRDTADGHIAYTDFDHGDANALPLAILTPQDPLQGLNKLAQQVAASGIKQIDGDVIIDARLFPQTQYADQVLSPILINDNLIDLTVTPGKDGKSVTVTSRPETASFTVKSDVKVIAAKQPTNLQVASPKKGEILVSGQIAADAKPQVRTYTVEDPPAYARTLLIEALQRAGVTVSAPVVAENPVNKLLKEPYSQSNQVALLTSLPFSENIKLVNKVSQNLHANTLVMLMSAKKGTPGFDEGVAGELPFLQKAGVDANGMTLNDGQGLVGFIAPRSLVQLLHYMATRPDFRSYFDSLPILGVDGSLATTVPANSPARGKVYAKTGTDVIGDALNQRALTKTKALGGYMTAASGRELVFNFAVNNIPIESVLDVLSIGNDLGTLAEIVYRAR
ncbi:MAG TPA: D-alanyl-D-alanine carboxypeptidase/D-alanyl-D-alanine-endopeptidase [Candidatus Caenarcaniphilales bacterium]